VIWLYLVASALSALSAALAWLAKLRWSREYAAAKDAIIASKDAQIGLLEREILGLKELSPMKIREYFLSMREQLEEYNGLLQKQLGEARLEVERKNTEILTLQAPGSQHTAAIVALTAERDQIRERADQLEKQLMTLEQIPERTDTDQQHAPELLEEVSQTSAELSHLLGSSSWSEIAAKERVLHQYVRELKRELKMAYIGGGRAVLLDMGEISKLNQSRSSPGAT